MFKIKQHPDIAMLMIWIIQLKLCLRMYNNSVLIDDCV